MPGRRLTIAILASIAAVTIAVAGFSGSLLPAAAAAHRQQDQAAVNAAPSSSAPPARRTDATRSVPRAA